MRRNASTAGVPVAGRDRLRRGGDRVADRRRRLEPVVVWCAGCGTHGDRANAMRVVHLPELSCRCTSGRVLSRFSRREPPRHVAVSRGAGPDPRDEAPTVGAPNGGEGSKRPGRRNDRALTCDFSSGWADLNRRSPVPQTGALDQAGPHPGAAPAGAPQARRLPLRRPDRQRARLRVHAAVSAANDNADAAPAARLDQAPRA